ncbi:hypothetical protein [Pedobacter nutrimenti]|uniref:hypothetical protein n=1 Tax=Pedobacter nutrimenti TaxID=1241337 RepID=UPI00292D2417|nr:hypothetical protein [Pedobacter nutrimenti]
MIRKLLALASLLLLSGRMWSSPPPGPDIEQQLGKITTPSATVASLLKFTDIPISYYTGTPNISVPIYTINTGKLNLPITLKYGASGIRVSENASNVGLGWSLSAEGVLQESVMGIPDNNSYHQNGLGWDNAALLNTNPTDQALLESLSTGGLDGAPDIYTFNFAGYSGKFIYADVIRTLPQQNLAITTYLNGSGKPEWKVVLQDGTQYFFGIIENIANRTSQSITRSRTWYLTKIVDANNTDSIAFAYEPTVTTEVIGRSYYFYAWRPTSQMVLPFDDDMQPNDPPKPGNYNQIEQISQGWQLKTITWNQGSIEYDIAYDRQDMAAGSPRVKNLFLKNKDGETIRVIHLEHSYFQTPNVNDEMGKRLRLESVTFAPDLNSLSASTAYKYAFEYDPLPLPSKLSNRIDHWGFYNGASINDSRGLIPSFTYPGMNYYGANRNANPNFTKAAMLTKMYYPTGGYAAYTWDVHAKNYPTQLLDSVIVYTDTIIQMEFACDSTEELQGEWEDHISIPTTPTDLFGSGVAANWYISMSTVGNIPLTVNHAAGGGWLLERPNGSSLSTTPVIPASKTFTHQTIQMYQYDKDVTLLPGKYYGIKGHINAPGFGIQVGLKAKWPKKVANTYTPPSDYLGGCRIRKIVLFDTFTRKTVVKNYEYSLPSFVPVPEYHQPLLKYFFYNNGNPPQGNATDCSFYLPIEGMSVSSNSVHNINAGVQSGYSWVKETIGNGADGSTVYNFTNFNELDMHGEFPASWRYGRLTQKSEYTNLNAETRRTTYSNVTSLNPAENFAGHTASRIAAHPCYSPGGMYLTNYDQKVYSFPCDWIYTDTVKVEDYMTGVTTVTVNSYDNPQHREITRSTTFLSDGSKQTNFIKYPTDYTFGSAPSGDAAAIAQLQQRHMHNTPVEQYTQKWLPGSSQALTLGGNYTQFGIVNLTATGVVQTGMQTLDINAEINNFQPSAANTNTLTKDSRYTIKGTIEEYDGRFNPLSILGEGNAKVGYIWGYDNTIPIAIVRNGYYSNKRAFTSFEKNAAGGWSFNPTAVITTDHFTGKSAYNLNLPGADITSTPNDNKPYIPGNYIISYWKKGGSVNVAGTITMTTGITTPEGWTYCEHLVNEGTPPIALQITGTALIDELRYYPKDAQMESFNYEPLIGITSRDDAGSHVVRYEYDAMGRLSVEKDVNGNILKKYTYQYLGDQ